MSQLPLFVRRIIFDFITTAAPTLLALQLAGDASSVLHAVGLALGAAAVAAVARNLPGLDEYLNDVLGLSGSASTQTQ